MVVSVTLNNGRTYRRGTVCMVNGTKYGVYDLNEAEVVLFNTTALQKETHPLSFLMNDTYEGLTVR